MRHAWIGFLGAVLGLSSVLTPGTSSAQTTWAQVAVEARRLSLETFDAVWETVRDTHFDPDLNGVDWEGVRDELRPRAGAARTPTELRQVLWDMLLRLGQSHFLVLPGQDSTPRPGDDPSEIAYRELFNAPIRSRTRPSPGFEFRFADGEIVVTEVWAGSPAERTGIRPGWTLIAIDGREVSVAMAYLRERLAEDGLSHWLERKKKPSSRTYFHVQLAGDAGTEVLLTFRDGDGDPVQCAVLREPIPWTVEAIPGLGNLPLRVSARRLSIDGAAPDLAWIGIHYYWLPGTEDAFAAALDTLRTAEGLVIDLRGNQGGLARVAAGVAGHLVREGSLGTMKRRDRSVPLRVHPAEDVYEGPVAVLIDGGTGSASECFVAGMQDLERVRVFGEPSAGSALPSRTTPLPNGDRLLHATSDFLRKDGTSVEGHPIEPEVVVEFDRGDLLVGRDPVLETAVGWLSGQVPPSLR